MKSIILPILLLLRTSNSRPNDDTFAHFEDPRIRKLCALEDRSVVCASNNANVCALRMRKGEVEYRNYENHCFLFLSNMCENPGKEFYIAGSGACAQRLTIARGYRSIRRLMSNNTQAENVTGITETGNTETPASDTEAEDESSEKVESENTPGDQENANGKPLRMGLVTPKTRYNVTTAYDDHTCPGHCTEEYQPQCLIANRGFGMYFKYLTFVNHCQADLYYCEHSEEFAPPPGESEEMVKSSRLDWSFCASYRFLQFARFSEVASSMGHYGWLLGDYKYSHILSPAERLSLSGAPRHVPG